MLELFRKAFHELGIDGRVVATDMSELSAARHVADDARTVPACTDSAYIDVMLDTCRALDVGLVIPTIDPEMPVLSQSRSLFAKEGTRVVVSGAQTIDIAWSKTATHQWLVENDLPTVRQTSVESALTDREDWPLPLIVKPNRGSASVGVRTVQDVRSLELLVDRPDMIVQSLATGHEYTVDVYLDAQGKVRSAVPRRRIEVRGGEVSKGLTVRDTDVEGVARDVAAALPDATGVINVQLFAEPGRTPLVIELNPRFGGGFPLTWAAGQQYPTALLAEHIGRDPTRYANDYWIDGLLMLRYDEAVFTTVAALEADQP